MKVTVDKEILEFLKPIYFGAFTEPIKVASSRAYRDMNRTIRFNAMPSEERLSLGNKINCIFTNQITDLCNGNVKSQED